MKKQSLQSNIAVVAWLTAVAALGLTIWQIHETRRHNKLSVQPLLNINTDFSNDADFIGMSISNQGLGPGRIKLIRLYVDGQPVADATKDGWVKVLDKLGFKDFTVDYTFYSGQHAVLTAGSTLNLFGLRKINVTDAGISKIEASLKRLGVAVCYCSLYEECDYTTLGDLNEYPCQ